MYFKANSFEKTTIIIISNTSLIVTCPRLHGGSVKFYLTKINNIKVFTISFFNTKKDLKTSCIYLIK
jgi:hypothetical protein